jgi:hypothetical protein
VIVPVDQRMKDKIGSSNIEFTLSDQAADQTLRHVLTVGMPDILCTQEWDGPAPDLDTQRRKAIGHDLTLTKATAGTSYKFRRPGGGGSPVVWNDGTHALESIESRQLAPAQDVGRLPGRKTHLPASMATVAVFRDRRTGVSKVVINVHLTAEVQLGKGYRTDRRHRPRVARHLHERNEIHGIVMEFITQPRTRVYVCGDTNYDDMPLSPLVACWVGHRAKEREGTLGSRTPDYVYAETQADSVQIIPTRSDHDSIVAVYLYNVRA